MSPSQSVNIRYFALLREISGRSEECWSFEAGTTLADLYRRVASHYSLPLGIEEVRVAVNDEFTQMEYILSDKDNVAFIPPVSGG